jgi:glycosyltransferase involved in cell wall biosynthesis
VVYPELCDISAGPKIYDISDDQTAYARTARWSRLAERAGRLQANLLERGLRVLRVSLDADQLSTAATPVRFLPNGVDMVRARAALDSAVTSDGFAALRRPLIGYVGGFGPRMDWQLMDALSARRPSWEFVFIGGEPPSDAPKRENTHYFGSASWQDILRAASQFDVGIIPFVDSAATRGLYSIKTFDYLAAGTPVVAATLPFSVTIQRQHPASIRLATPGDADDWLEALTETLSSPEAPAVHIAAANEHRIEARTNHVLTELTEFAARSHAEAAGH